jgi:molybdopterin converting factor small subunit
VAQIRLLGPAREAAGASRVHIDGHNVGEIVTAAMEYFGEPFSSVLRRSRLWVNGEEANLDTPVDCDDEVAVIPPVSGGCW